MPRPVAISQFLPTLLIPKSDRTLLQELATTLVMHNFEQYSNLHVTKDGRPDSRQWVPTRKTERIRIYQERRSPKESPPAIPSLLLLGTISGKLEDIMDGVKTPDSDSPKIKSSCIHDGLVESKVLEELVSPTENDPYHHVRLQWRLYKDRDYVTLDTTGIMKAPWGERVGYNVSHSVGFSQLPEFTGLGISRGNMSVCSIYSQKATNIVGCYTRGFYDLSTDTHNHTVLALQSIATLWLSFSRHMECTHMKKLACRLRKYRDDSDIVQFTPMRPKLNSDNSTCQVCAKSLLSFLPGRKKTCKNCNHAVCSRCCVKRLVCVLAPDQRSTFEKKRTVCSRCIDKGVHTDAKPIARDEVATMCQ